MKQLNRTAKKLFRQFLDKMDEADELEISVKDRPILKLTREQEVQTDEGRGFIFGIGTLLNKPKNQYVQKFEFLVVDQRVNNKGSMVFVFPKGTRDDVNGVYEDAIWIEDGKVKHYMLTYQHEQARAAFVWLLELETAGYLD